MRSRRRRPSHASSCTDSDLLGIPFVVRVLARGLETRPFPDALEDLADPGLVERDEACRLPDDPDRRQEREAASTGGKHTADLAVVAHQPHPEMPSERHALR